MYPVQARKIPMRPRKALQELREKEPGQRMRRRLPSMSSGQKNVSLRTPPLFTSYIMLNFISPSCENIRPCSACVDSGLDCLDYAASHPRVRKQQGRRKKSGREKKFQVHNLVLDIPSVSDSKNPDPRKAADGCRKSRRKKNGKCEETKPRSSCSVFSEADIDQVGSSVFLSSTMPISESRSIYPFLSNYPPIIYSTGDYGEVVTSTSARRPVVSAGTVTSFGNSQRSPYEYTSQHFPLPSISNFNTPSSRMDFNLYSSSRYVRNLSRSPVSSSAFADESLLLSMTTSSIRSTYMLC